MASFCSFIDSRKAPVKGFHLLSRFEKYFEFLSAVRMKAETLVPLEVEGKIPRVEARGPCSE
jgi:hypothetical protein